MSGALSMTLDTTIKGLGIILIAIAASFVVVAGAPAQQVPIPTTAAEVPGPAAGTAMTKAYVQIGGADGLPVGLAAGQSANRCSLLQGARTRLAGRRRAGRLQPERHADRLCQPGTALHRLPEPGRRVRRRLLDLDKEPIVFQVPDFGDRFWVYALYDARTDEFSEIGKQYGTKPGFYLMVGPNWKGETPAGITAVVRSSTSLAFAVPRIFMDDTRGGSRRPSSRCSVRSSSTRCRSSTGR